MWWVVIIIVFIIHREGGEVRELCDGDIKLYIGDEVRQCCITMHRHSVPSYCAVDGRSDYKHVTNNAALLSDIT